MTETPQSLKHAQDGLKKQFANPYVKQIFTEHLFYTKHCAGHWKYNYNKSSPKFIIRFWCIWEQKMWVGRIRTQIIYSIQSSSIRSEEEGIRHNKKKIEGSIEEYYYLFLSRGRKAHNFNLLFCSYDSWYSCLQGPHDWRSYPSVFHQGIIFQSDVWPRREKNQFFMWFSKAFLLPDNYFINFFYSGKSEYPIFLCTAKVKHRNEHDTVNIYAQFICIWLLWNKAYVAISR